MSCKGNFYVARSDLQIYVHLLNNTHNLTLTRCKDFGGSDLCAIISMFQMWRRSPAYLALMINQPPTLKKLYMY